MNDREKVIRQSRSLRLTRRRALQLGAVGAASFVGLSGLACDGDDDSSGDTAPSAGATSTTAPSASSQNGGAPVSGGTLRLGVGTSFGRLEPHLPGGARHFLWEIFDRITLYDENYQPQPQLATSWEQSGDGLQVVLKLRPGVTFHTGREFTSEDIAWNFERVKDPELPYATFRFMAGWFPTVETPAKDTVVLKADKPRPGTFDLFELLCINDQVTAEGPDTERKLVGTGPWKFVEWRPDELLHLAKNETYWDTGRPYLDELIWNLPMDPKAMVAQFEAGGLEAIKDPEMSSFARFRDEDSFQTLSHPQPGGTYLMGYNNSKTPFEDNRVRQAFSWAIDRERYTDLILKGIAEPASLPWPKTSLAYEEDKNNHYSLDLKKAADLLSAAGATGLTTEVLIGPLRPEVVEFMPIWQEDLKSIGVDLVINLVAQPTWGQKVVALDYDAIWALSVNFAALGSPGTLFAATPQLWSGDGKNQTAFTNPRWQELIEEMQFTFDEQEQRSLYSEWNDLYLDSAHIQSTAPQAERLAMVKNLNGVKPLMHDTFSFAHAWLAKD